MKSISNQRGSAHAIIAIIIMVALLGGLGFVYWKNVSSKNEAKTASGNSSQNNKAESKCGQGEDETATSGVFCSDDYGVKFEVPADFKNSLKKTNNEPVNALQNNEIKQVGTTKSIYSAEYTKGQYKYALTVLLLPQIDKMTVGLIAAGEFDASEKKLYALLTTSDNPDFHREGEYKFVNSKNGIKVYRDTFGDVGYMIYRDVVINGDTVVIVDLKATPSVDIIELTDTATIDDSGILETIALLK